MDPTTTTGRCHCGAVTYRLSAPSTFAFLCHCDNCRKLSGGARLFGVSFPRGSLTTMGSTTTYRYRGGKDEIELHFCGVCGTHLYALPAAHADIVVVRGSSLDDPNAATPRKSIYGEQACAWDKLL